MSNNFSYSALVKNDIIRFGLMASLIAAVVQWIIFGIYGWQLPPEIPLYFSLPPGESQLVSRDLFILIPLMSVVVTATNVFIIRLNKDTPAIYPQIVAWTNALITFLATISMVHIIMLVR